MTMAVQVNVQVDTEYKAFLDRWAAELGLKTSSAIRLVLMGRLPPPGPRTEQP